VILRLLAWLLLTLGVGCLGQAGAFWQSRDSNFNVSISGGGPPPPSCPQTVAAATGISSSDQATLGAANTAITSTVDVPAGSSVVVAANMGSSLNATASQLIDSNGNTYILKQPGATSGNTNAVLGYNTSVAHIPTGSTWTLSSSATGTWFFRGAYLSCTNGPLDQSVTLNQATATLTVTLSSGTLGSASETAYGYTFPNNPSGVITTGTGFTTLFGNNANDVAYLIRTGSSGAISYNPSWPNSGVSSNVLLTFYQSYAGPGDTVGSWLGWWGLRAFSAATKGTRLIKVCNSTGGTDTGCTDVSSNATSGVIMPQTIGGIACPGANCTIQTFYDQAGTHDVTQNSITSRATWSTTCGGLTEQSYCASSAGAAFYNSATPAYTQSQPYSTYGVFLPGLSGAGGTGLQNALNISAGFQLIYRQSDTTFRFGCGTAGPVTQSAGV